MAYDNQSFIQKLRQNQILKPEGQGLPDPYIGMPNFGAGGNGGQQQQQFFDPRGMVGESPTEQRANINAVRMEVPTNNMASAWVRGAADENAADIVKGTTPNEVLGRGLALQQNKNALGWGNLDIKSRAQDLKELIQSGRATDEEKQEYALSLIEARGNEAENQIGMRGRIQSDLLDKRGQQATGLQELKGTQQSSLQGVKGEQRLGEIAARALGRDEGMKPSQLINQRTNNIQQLMLQEPELSKFLIKNPNTGQFEISPKADAETRSRINQRITGDNVNLSEDISLSPSPTYNNNTLRGLPAKPAVTPGSTTPKADGQTQSKAASKYSYTVK